MRVRRGGGGAARHVSGPLPAPGSIVNRASRLDADGRGALEQQRVRERLGQVAAHLALRARRTPPTAARAARTRRGCARTSAPPAAAAPAGPGRAPSRSRRARTLPRPPRAPAHRAGSGSSRGRRRARARRPRRSPPSAGHRPAPRRAGPPGAAPRRGAGHPGARCQRPDGCRASPARVARRSRRRRRASALACRRPAACAAIARRPAAQISRLWVHALRRVELPDAGVGFAPTLEDRRGGELGRLASRRASRWSCRAAAASSSRTSPKASSWNCRRPGCR